MFSLLYGKCTRRVTVVSSANVQILPEHRPIRVPLLGELEAAVTRADDATARLEELVRCAPAASTHNTTKQSGQSRAAVRAALSSRVER